MHRNYVQQISLRNYRNFEQLELSITSNNALILGNNGIGKTNILEALSLLTPGRGIRGARLEELCQRAASSFNIEILMQTSLGAARIKNSYNADSAKRIVEFNDSKITSTELAKLCNIIWLTPQMEGLFLGASSDRRKFFDRIVYSFHPEHAQLINKYDYYMRERNAALQMYVVDTQLLDILENKLSHTAYAITQNRTNAITILQHSIDSSDVSFPKARLELSPSYNAYDIEALIQKFHENRAQDKQSKKTNFGTHRTDLLIYYQAKDVIAKQCSTGEQKALLISIILGQLTAIQRDVQKPTLLLLDETYAHLDETRREYLTAFLANIDAQIFITSTEGNMDQYFTNAQKINL